MPARVERTRGKRTRSASVARDEAESMMRAVEECERIDLSAW